MQSRTTAVSTGRSALAQFTPAVGAAAAAAALRFVVCRPPSGLGHQMRHLFGMRRVSRVLRRTTCAAAPTRASGALAAAADAAAAHPTTAHPAAAAALFAAPDGGAHLERARQL